MMKGRILIIVLLALGVASVAWAQQPPAQLKFSRVVDLTIPIESNMPGIPGIKTYADNPSRVDVVTAITEAQKSQLQTEGMTLNSNLAVNGRAMITVLSILVHNGTHIDAPRHMLEKGSPIDQMPLGQLVKEGVLINLPNKGPNSVDREGHRGKRSGARTQSHSRHPHRLYGKDLGQAGVLDPDALSGGRRGSADGKQRRTSGGAGCLSGKSRFGGA